MKVIDGITYNYFKVLKQQQQKILLQQQLSYINDLLTFDKKHFILNSAQIIYEQICNLIPSNLKYLIYQEDFINSKLFNQYCEKYLSNIIIQSKDKNTYENQNSKIMRILNKTFQNTSKKLSILQEQRLENIKYILTQGFWGKVWDITKKATNFVVDGISKIGSAIWNGLKAFGEAVFNFFKQAYAYLKLGFQMITKFFKGKSGYGQVSQIKADYEKMNQHMVKGLPFLKSTLQKGNQTAKSQSKDTEQKVEEVLAKGGNADKIIKQSSDSVGNKAGNTMNGQLSTNGVKQAEEKNKELQESSKENKSEDKNKDKKEDKKDSSSLSTKDEKDEKDNKSQEEKDNSEEKLIYQNYATKLIKDCIIQMAYHGLTPKTVIQESTGKSYGNIQNDIVINNSKLSFRTRNNLLICEETNLSTNEKIIYQTNEQFIGNHLIFEQSTQKYEKRNIISQQKKAIILEMNLLLWLAVIIGAIVLIFGIYKLLKFAILKAIDAITAGFTTVTNWLLDKATDPTGSHLSTMTAAAIYSHPWIAAGTAVTVTAGAAGGVQHGVESHQKNKKERIDKAKERWANKEKTSDQNPKVLIPS